jgi:hypothetical protein
MLHLILSSDSHVFEPSDLWQTRIDAAFQDRAPRIERIDGADQIVVVRSSPGSVSSRKPPRRSRPPRRSPPRASCSAAYPERTLASGTIALA